MHDPATPLRPQHPDPRPLTGLLQHLGLRAEGSPPAGTVSGVASRAQAVAVGDLFVALPGARAHGAEFARAAAAAGAVAVLTDPAGARLAAGAGLPVLVADRPRALLGAAAAWVHRTRDRAPLLLGVTGTNGKTTTVHLLEHLLQRLDVPAGVSSTTERGFGDERAASTLTTPEADELHALLARMAESGVRAAALEVSAQALVRHRVDGVLFDVAGFTNLTHDHLDDFGTMGAYLRAKASLFQPGRSRSAVVCVDGAAGRRIAAGSGVPTATVTTLPGGTADWRVSGLRAEAEDTAFSLRGPDGARLEVAVGLLGTHQAANAAVAIVMLLQAGWPVERLAEALAAGPLRPALPGRLERVPGSEHPAVWLDVAHTPDALAKALEALRPRTAGRVVVVFGADGDRDPTKRAPMGRIAAALADEVVLHDHHSRFEDPERVLAMVLEGTGRGPEVHVVLDPSDAVRFALARAGSDGAVLWAGTGRTGYRDVRGAKRPYSFWEEAGLAVRDRAADGAQRVASAAAR